MSAQWRALAWLTWSHSPAVKTRVTDKNPRIHQKVIEPYYILSNLNNIYLRDMLNNTLEDLVATSTPLFYIFTVLPA